MLRVDADILVQVEADGPGEVQHARPVHADQRLIGGNGGRARRQAEDAVRLAQELSGNDGGCCLADLTGMGEICTCI